MIEPRRPLADGVVADHYQELDRLYREIWGEHVRSTRVAIPADEIPNLEDVAGPPW